MKMILRTLLSVFGMIGAAHATDALVLEHTYAAGNSLGEFAMSPNAKFIAVQVYVWPGGDRNRAYQAVHLIDNKAQLLWDVKFTEIDNIISSVSVSDQGHVVVTSAAGITGGVMKNGKYEWHNYVTMLDRHGDVLWRKRFEDNTRNGAVVSANGKYACVVLGGEQLALYSVPLGDRIWIKDFGDVKLNQPSIAQDGSVITVYDGAREIAIVLDGRGNQLWNGSCLYSGVRISPSGAFVTLLQESREHIGFLEKILHLYDISGKLITLQASTRDWHDFAVTNDGTTVCVEEGRSDKRGLIISKAKEVGATSGGWKYYLDPPPGGNWKGSARVEVSADGQLIALNTPLEIHILKVTTFEKKW